MCIVIWLFTTTCITESPVELRHQGIVVSSLLCYTDIGVNFHGAMVASAPGE